MKINERELLRLINQKSWQFPLLIVALATPFMVLAIATEDQRIEIFAKLALLLISLIFLAYNLLHRYLRKKFEGEHRI